MNASSKRPHLTGHKRAKAARERRAEATYLSQDPSRPPFEASDNGDNAAYDTRPLAFTKGLEHDAHGILVDQQHYERFEDALTQPGPDGSEVETAFDVPGTKAKGYKGFKTQVNGDAPKVRTWESPLAGVYYVEEGPDPGAIGMPGAPRLGSSELCAEIAEVYAMALVRDMDLDDLSNPNATLTYCDPDGMPQPYQVGGKDVKVSDLVEALNKFNWFNPKGTPYGGTDERLSTYLSRPEELRRMRGRRTPEQTERTLFRGSAPGAQDGDYLSIFLKQEEPAYGAHTINQKIKPVQRGLDYMTNWTSWLDVQNGIDLRGISAHSTEARRVVTNGRDLSRYVHIDALYQAYHVAALVMAGSGDLGNDPGMPENGDHPTRDAFASFGGPHALALFAEVSSRALKAVRRQKFQIHRRGRPERLAALLTLVANGEGARLGNAGPVVQQMLDELQANFGPFLDLIAQHNARQNSADWSKKREDMTKIQLTGQHGFEPAQDKNFLLPMAFPEGSPMHPAYGAGHATVAGACVTILKAFFRTVDPDTWASVPIEAVDALEGLGSAAGLTVEGELNKLAANISIGRDFAGVHYYSDYYESLRLGERVAVGILHEQMTNYNEAVAMHFHSFDGDRITVERTADGDITLDVGGGTPQWWLRNTGAPIPPVSSDWLGV